MPDPDVSATPAADPSNEPAPAVEPGGLPANDPNGEGTTPEEVAEVLKSSGIKIPAAEAEAPADDEEGDEPDEPAPVVPDEEPDEEEEPAPPAEPETPAPVATTDDDKYSLQVEDANGVTYKISVGAKMEDIMAEFEPKNNGQILDILSQLSDLKDQKVADEAKAAGEAADEDRRTRASELLTGWQEEATVLQGSKRIPEGTDGEARINEVYKFMADENTKRMEAGKPTLNSFEDALDKMEAKEGRDKVVADAKTAKDKARENGGKVGGASAPASSGPPVYRANSARNINQAIRAAGLLE